MLTEIKEHLVRHKLKDKLITRKVNKKSHALLSKAYGLENKLKKPVRKNSFTGNNTLQFSGPSPLVSQSFKNDHVPKASLVKLLSGVTRESIEDSDEVFSEENASTRDKVKSNVLLENIRNGTDSDSDSVGPITDDSDENENEGDSAPGHEREVDRVSDDEEKPDEDTESILAYKDQHETTVSPEDDINKDVDDEDEYMNAEDEDGTKPGHGPEEEGQPLHSLDSLKKLREGKNHKISPYQISDQMSQQMLRIYGDNRDQTAARLDRERHLEALNKLMAFSAQIKQETLQRLRLGYRNAFVQNAALRPQFYIQQPLGVVGVPEVPRKAPLLLDPTAAIYRPAYVAPSRTASLLPQSSNQGYSINVDGLHGVFSKTPGYVVRFHSPDSEVTVVKKEKVVNPMTATGVLQIEAD